MSMASCIACQACSCASSAACSYLCGKFGSGGQTPENITKNTSRFTYFVLFLISVIASWIFRDQVTPDLCKGTGEIFCKNLVCPADQQTANCMARAFVLRVAFATAIFHISLAMATWGVNDFSNPRHYVHTALWPIKIVFWLVLHLIVFFIPSSTFLNFGWAAFVFGVLFEIVQIVIYIEICFSLNRQWIEEDGAENLTGSGHIKVMAVSFCCFAAAIGQTVVMFLWFGTNMAGETDGCELYQFFSSFSLILWVFLTIFSFRATEWMPDTGLMPSALVAAFLCFKTLSALYSQITCNKIASSAETNYSGPPEVMSAISIVIAVIIAGWASLNVGRELDSDGGAFWGPSAEPRSSPLVEMGAVAPNQMTVDVEGAENNAAPELKGKLGYDAGGFHAAVACSICYIAMQMTNWNQEFSKDDVDKGSASM